jgi:membrane protein implicated in regulation of membrane protease activity
VNDCSAEGVLLTGVYGSGKSSVAEEIAYLLEQRGERYALLDLDYLSWAGTGSSNRASEFALMLRNLAAVAANYRRAGIRRFVLAYFVRSPYEVRAVRQALGLPLRVARLTVGLSEIERRLADDVTSGRREAVWVLRVHKKQIWASARHDAHNAAVDRVWAAWLVLASLLGPAEAWTRRMFFGPGVLGALGGAGVAAAGGRFWLQVGAFALLVASGLAARRALLRPYLKAVVREGRLIGTARVSEQVSDQAGRVRYGGTDWAARSFGIVIPPGTKVGIAGMTDDSVFRVYPKDAARQAAKTARSAPVVRISWREASAARGKLTGGYLLTPEERLCLLRICQARWRYTDRLYRRAFVGFIGFFSAGLLAIGALGLGPAIRAARGEGTRGVFTARTLSCDRTCSWTGTFTAGNRQVWPDVMYDGALPPATHPGSIVPALYPGGSNDVFAVRGSTAWRIYAVLMPAASAGVLASLWFGPIRYLRLRRNDRSADGDICRG